MRMGARSPCGRVTPRIAGTPSAPSPGTFASSWPRPAAAGRRRTVECMQRTVSEAQEKALKSRTGVKREDLALAAGAENQVQLPKAREVAGTLELVGAQGFEPATSHPRALRQASTTPTPQAGAASTPGCHAPPAHGRASRNGFGEPGTVGASQFRLAASSGLIWRGLQEVNLGGCWEVGLGQAFLDLLSVRVTWDARAHTGLKTGPRGVRFRICPNDRGRRDR